MLLMELFEKKQELEKSLQEKVPSFSPIPVQEFLLESEALEFELGDRG